MRCRQLEKISFPPQLANLLSHPGHLISLGGAQRASFRRPLRINPSLSDPATQACWVNAKALGGFQNGQSLVLAEGNGFSLLLRRESAALSSHGVHYRLGRRLSDLSIEQGQPHKAEYFLLVQRPTAAMHFGTIELNLKNFPLELERWDISVALDEAQRQVEIEVEKLQAARAAELNKEDLAYLPFEFKSGGATLMGPWMQGLFKPQILEILTQTESPKLKLYLNFLVQNISTK